MEYLRRNSVMSLRNQTLLVFVLMASAAAAFGQERVRHRDFPVDSD
jgi:hypothetical protein